MTTPTEKISTPVQAVSLAKTTAILPPVPPSAMAWDAPVPKPNPLILKKRPLVSTALDAVTAGQVTAGSATPFPAPVQAEAFTVPRPVIVEPMSPWGQPVARVDFLALWRTGLVRAEAGFPRPPLRAVRSSDPTVGFPCHSC